MKSSGNAHFHILSTQLRNTWKTPNPSSERARIKGEKICAPAAVQAAWQCKMARQWERDRSAWFTATSPPARHAPVWCVWHRSHSSRTPSKGRTAALPRPRTDTWWWHIVTTPRLQQSSSPCCSPLLQTHSKGQGRSFHTLSGWNFKSHAVMSSSPLKQRTNCKAISGQSLYWTATCDREKTQYIYISIALSTMCRTGV